MTKREEIESDIAQLLELRERAVDHGQAEWAVRWIDARLAVRREQLKEITNSEKTE
jgi:hypothetical protein